MHSKVEEPLFQDLKFYFTLVPYDSTLGYSFVGVVICANVKDFVLFFILQ